MALPPTGSGTGGRIPERPEQRIARLRGNRAPANVTPTPPAAETPALPDTATPQKATPDRGYRLKTAISDADIERQIRRLMTLIANDNIDPDAPPGSYLNLLV